MDHITAVFENRDDAQNALAQLDAAGVTDDQVSLITTDISASRHFGIQNNTKAEEGATTGAAIGGLVGAVLAGIASAGAIAIPGMNLVVSGYLISALAGFGAGAAGGGIIGALVGLGFPEHEAKLYEDELSHGNILLAVKPLDGEQKKRVKEILGEANNPGDLAVGAARAASTNRTDIRT